MVSRIIITAQDIQELYFQGVKEIYIDPDTMLLPGAKDALKVAGIKLKERDSRESIREMIREICNEKKLDPALCDKIAELVLEKISMLGGD